MDRPDARNGFEIVASDTMPVEQDHVKLSCLASQFIYDEVRWKWKPMGTTTFSDINDSNGKGELRYLSQFLVFQRLVLTLPNFIERHVSVSTMLLDLAREAPSLL